MIRISSSLLSADFSCLEREIGEIEVAGAHMLHLDVMDGHFVPNISFGPAVISPLRKKTRLPFDVHLMVSRPDLFVDDLVLAGADMITFHLESDADPEKVIRLVRARGKNVGIAIRPKTRAEALEPYLARIDLALVMTVEPGFSGQKFLPDMLEKITYLSRWSRENSHPLLIGVDGGVNRFTAARAAACGADLLVVGSALFNALDRRKELEAILQNARSASGAL